METKDFDNLPGSQPAITIKNGERTQAGIKICELGDSLHSTSITSLTCHSDLSILVNGESPRGKDTRNVNPIPS